MRSITRKSRNFDASKATFKTIMDRNTYFQNRGTCRHFKDIDIAAATIEDIAQQAVGAPVLLTFCADLHRYTRWCSLNGADAGVDNIQALAWAWIDTALFAQQFNTIAEMRGFGCCYLGTTTFNGKDIAEILELPSLVMPVTPLAFGVPDSA